MTLTKAKTLYEQDFALWIEETVKQLKSEDFTQLDLENLVGEIESLGKRDKRELESRLITLFEHGLKRRYVPLPECYRGWEATLNRTQQELNRILKDSPSLKVYLQDILTECYQNALKNMKYEYDVVFPDICAFPENVDVLLNQSFWEA